MVFKTIKTLEAYDVDKIPLTSFQTFSRAFHSVPKLVWEFYRLQGIDTELSFLYFLFSRKSLCIPNDIPQAKDVLHFNSLVKLV